MKWKPRPNSPISEAYISLIDDEKNNDNHWWWQADISFDGCIHFSRAYNSPFPHDTEKNPMSDYIHICDLDEFIERLKALREAAINHFGEGWNECK